MIINEDLVSEYLLGPLESTKTTADVVYAETGPAELNLHALATKAERPFVARKSADKKRHKPTIIVSAFALRDHAPDSRVRELLAAIFRAGFKLQVWDGIPASLQQQAPCTSTVELWQRINNLHAAHESEIKKVLADHGQTMQDFLVLDQARLMRMRNDILRNDIYSDNSKSLATKAPINISLDPIITPGDELPLLPLTEAEFRLDLTEKSDALELCQAQVPGVSAVRVSARQVCVLNHELLVSQDDFLQLTDLTIDDAKAKMWSRCINSTPYLPKLERLTLKDSIISNLDLQSSKLQTLKLRGVSFSDGMVLVLPESVQDLVLDSITFNSDNKLPEIPNLRTLSLSQTDYSSLNYPKLQELTFGPSGLTKPINLSLLPKLEHLCFDSCQGKYPIIEGISAGTHSKLRKLTIAGNSVGGDIHKQLRTEITASFFPAPEMIEELMIDQCHSEKLDLSLFTGLKKLTISGGTAGKIILPVCAQLDLILERNVMYSTLDASNVHKLRALSLGIRDKATYLMGDLSQLDKQRCQIVDSNDGKIIDLSDKLRTLGIPIMDVPLDCRTQWVAPDELGNISPNPISSLPEVIVRDCRNEKERTYSTLSIANHDNIEVCGVELESYQNLNIHALRALRDVRIYTLPSEVLSIRDCPSLDSLDLNIQNDAVHSSCKVDIADEVLENIVNLNVPLSLLRQLPIERLTSCRSLQISLDKEGTESLENNNIELSLPNLRMLAVATEKGVESSVSFDLRQCHKLRKVEETKKMLPQSKRYSAPHYYEVGKHEYILCDNSPARVSVPHDLSNKLDIRYHEPNGQRPASFADGRPEPLSEFHRAPGVIEPSETRPMTGHSVGPSIHQRPIGSSPRGVTGMRNVNSNVFNVDANVNVANRSVLSSSHMTKIVLGDEPLNELYFQGMAFDIVDIENNQVKFKASGLNDQTLKSVKLSPYTPLAGVGVARAEQRCRLDQQNWTPLTTDVNYSELKSLQCDKPITIRRHPHTGMYFCRLAEEANEASCEDVIIHYNLSLPHIPADPKNDGLAEPSNPQYASAARSALSDVLALPKLKFVTDPTLTKQEKLAALRIYCNEFTEGEDFTDSELSSMSVLKEILRTQKGVCRHISMAFMTLAQIMGIDAMMMTNGKHAFPLVCYQKKDASIVWQAYEPGGQRAMSAYFADKKLSDFAQRSQQQSAQDSNEPIPSSVISDVSDAVTKMQDRVHVSKYKPKYDEYFDNNVRQHAFSSVHDLLLVARSQAKRPVVLLDSEQSPFALNEALIADLRKQKKDITHSHIYIDSVDEMRHFFHAASIGEQGLQLNDGPLKHIIEHGGLIVINWGNFPQDELAKYQSLLDKNATLFGKPVNKNAVIIGVVNNYQHIPDSLRTRIQLVRATNDLLRKLPAVESVQDVPTETVSIDLRYDTHLWQDRLLGRIDCKSGKLSIQGSPFAEQSGKSLHLRLYNPPDTPEFNAFLHRLRMGKVFFNGEFVTTTHVAVSIDHRPLTAMPKNVHIEPNENTRKQFERSNTLFLNNQTFSAMMQELQFDSNGYLDVTSGILTDDMDDVHFVVTDHVRQADWLRLTDYAASPSQQHRHFHFHLAPGAAIADIAEGEASIHPQGEDYSSSKSRILCSNDPDLLTLSAVAKDPVHSRVVHIHPGMSLQEILLSQRPRIDEAGKVIGTENQSGVMRELLTNPNANIIITGEPNAECYQALLPLLLSAKPRLRQNGQWHEVKGKITLITPPTQQMNYPLLNPSRHDYTFDDYLVELGNIYKPAELKAKRQLAQKVIAFHEKANLWPHAGEQLPSSLRLSFARLQHAIRLLENQPQQRGQGASVSNPLKSLFLRDYPKDHPAYAYMNVMAKWQFGQNVAPDDPVKRRQKIIQVYRELFGESAKVTKPENWWKVLNALPIQSLRHDFKDLNALADFSKKPPKIRQEVINKLKWTLLSLGDDLPVDKSMMAKFRQQLQFQVDEHDMSPIIFIKGEPGVGKTHTVRAMAKEGKINIVEEDILAFLRSKPTNGQDVFLFIDEFNTLAPGAGDFLKAIAEGASEVYYAGQWHPITPYHRVIVTGNPESMPGRHYHQVLQDHACTILCPMPSTYDLKRGSLKDFVNMFGHEAADQLIAAFYAAKAYQTMVTLSCRDIITASIRCKGLVDEGLNLPDALLQSSIHQFTLSIKEKIDREQCQRDIKTCIPDSTLPRLQQGVVESLDDFHILASRAPMVTSLRESLDNLRFSSKAKASMLLQGGAGLGKSTLYLEVLHAAGYSRDNPDTSYRYVHVTAGGPETRQQLLAAFNNGSVVVFDEVNMIDEETDKLLCRLLTGEDMDGKPAKNPGFMLCGSQNAVTYSGRKALSGALHNRLQFVELADHTYEEHIALTEAFGIDSKHAQALVTCFNESARRHPDVTDERTFFNCVRHHAPQSPRKIETAKSFIATLAMNEDQIERGQVARAKRRGSPAG